MKSDETTLVDPERTPPGRSDRDPTSQPVAPARVDRALVQSRTLVERLERRRKWLDAGCTAAICVAGVCALLPLVSPRFDPARYGSTLAIPIVLLFAVAIAALALARRYGRDAAALRQEIFWLEFVRTAIDHRAVSSVRVHPYRVRRDGDDPPVLYLRDGGILRERAAAPAAKRERRTPPPSVQGLATPLLFMALVVAVALLSVESPSARHHWAFTETSATASELGLDTPVRDAGSWTISPDDGATGGRALVNDAGARDRRPSLALTKGLAARDFRASTRCKVLPPGAACGLAFRVRDPSNYYAATVDARSGVVSLIAVVAGVERTIREQRGAAVAAGWQEVVVEAHGDRVRVSWNGAPAIDLRDSTFTGSGAVGLWTRAPDVAAFDELSMETIPRGAQPLPSPPPASTKRVST
jgi:hypothetical protein